MSAVEHVPIYDEDAECPKGHVGKYRKQGRNWRCTECERERIAELRADPDYRQMYNERQRLLMRQRRAAARERKRKRREAYLRRKKLRGL
jgi:hypothetical protein